MTGKYTNSQMKDINNDERYPKMCSTNPDNRHVFELVTLKI